MANESWAVERSIQGTPYWLRLSPSQLRRCMILFLRFLDRRRPYSEVEAYLALVTDCPSTLCSALAITLQYRCFVAGRLTDTSFMEKDSGPIKLWRTERGTKRLAELIAQYGDVQEVRVG